MGKLARIQELEDKIARLEKRASLPKEAMRYIRDLAELPEDAVLLYTLSDQRISHQIGLSARVILGKLDIGDEAK